MLKACDSMGIHTFQSLVSTPRDAMTNSTFFRVSGTASLSSSMRFLVQSCQA